MLLNTDFYKFSHGQQYPKGTTKIYANWTARSWQHAPWQITEGVIFYGLEYLLSKLSKLTIPYNNELKLPSHIAKQFSDLALYMHNHKQKLPLKIKSLEEGTLVPFGVPMLTIENTDPNFYWLVNYLETAISSILWPMCTVATIAHAYKTTFERYAQETSDIPEFVDYQGHDFSCRGLFGLEAMEMAGLAHLSQFKGTDNVIAQSLLNGDLTQYVPATEHSVMCVNGMDEKQTIIRLIKDVYPTGIVSIVCDTWDFWHVVDNILTDPEVKEAILNRDGKVVVRPDSGDPVDVLCGTDKEEGLIKRLYNNFGGTVNSKGYIQLNDKIGAIYGDAITLDRQEKILFKLKEQGFASTNVVLGIGSYSYQGNTRDTFGFAMKTTYAEVDGIGMDVYKAPKGQLSKWSAKGLLSVIKQDDKLVLIEGTNNAEGNLLHDRY